MSGPWATMVESVERPISPPLLTVIPGTIAAMDLYGQDDEVQLLGRALSRLETRIVVDVGAERGSFVSAMLGAGAAAVHAAEPEPRNLAFLRERFRDESRVTIHDCAISRADGPVELHLSSDPSGLPLTFAHTLVERADSAEMAWQESIAVAGRSIASLVAEREIPARVAILKVDTEGHDLEVISGLGELDCDVIMTEHWVELPNSLGPCPWTTEEMLAAVAPRGFRHFAFFTHRGECTIVQWDDGRIPVGFAGNLLFFHDRVVDALMPEILEAATTLGRAVVEVADRRLDKIAELDRERALQMLAAEERLTKMDDLESDRKLQQAKAERRVARIEELERELELQTRTAAERLAIIEKLERQTKIAVEELEAERTIARTKAQAQRTIELPLRRLRYELGRMRALTQPRLGNLRHYSPQPLELPTHYFRVPMPDPAPMISVVTPSFAHGRFIERTLWSVLDQGYPALEYFVQDGGSTDETLEILQRYGDRLSGWVSEPDGGQADAINRGFARTTGEIMAWLNSDDLLLPGSLAYVAAFFAAHQAVDVVYGHRVMIDDCDGRIGAWIMPRHDDRALTLADFVPQETLFWRRRIWDQVGGGLDLDFGYALDWDLLLRFREAGAKMERLPRFLGAFRVHDAQKTLAAHPLGEVEMARLRERVHGRSLSIAEVNDGLRPYLRRHVVLHLRQRVVDRLPKARAPIQRLGSHDVLNNGDSADHGPPDTPETAPVHLPGPSG
jgi:FkbM family methyltransferase